MILNRPNILNRLNILNGTGGLPPVPSAWRNYTDTTLAATPLSSTSMGLAWTNPVIQGATLSEVLVYRGTDGVNFSLVETLGVITSWTDTGLTEGTLYYYRLAFRSSRGVVTGMGGIKSGITFVEMSDAYFTAMTEQIPTPTKTIIDTAIKTTATQLGKLDCVMLTLANEQQSLLWLNDPTKTGVKVNSPTFTPFKGWNGDATNYIALINPSDAGNKLQINDGSLLAYINNLPSSVASIPILGQSSTALSGRIGIGTDSSAILIGNWCRADGTLSQYLDTKGFLSIRRGGTGIVLGVNKTFKGNAGIYAATFIKETIKIGSNRRTPLQIIGAYLTDQELSDFQDAWLPVLEHLGSDYWSNFTPTTLTATAGAGKIDLAWTLPVTTYSPYTVTNVVIQESTDNVTFTDLTTLGAVTSHSVTVPTGQTRYYKIRYVSSRNIHTTNSAEAHATAL